MKILITLGEVLNRCSDWKEFCTTKGYDGYCVANGAGEHEIELTEQEALDFNLIFYEHIS
jgi:hypothetical protein